MIKASEGGGGKGIRKVLEPGAVKDAFRQVQGEVPGSPIFVMKMASGARHLEVQLLADEFGEAISLSGRDCSVQRRHQKIIEEGPPLAPSSSTWRAMEAAAVRLAKAVNYANAGTVEYLFLGTGLAQGENQRPGAEGEAGADDSKLFSFLELNPRLQVRTTAQWCSRTVPYSAEAPVCHGLRGSQLCAPVRLKHSPLPHAPAHAFPPRHPRRTPPHRA